MTTLRWTGLALFTLLTTASAVGCSSGEAAEEPRASTEQAIAPAIAIGACLADPPCAALVVATIGYVVHMASQIKPGDRPAAQEAANDYAAGATSDPDPVDDCKKVASKWQLEEAGIDAHEAKAHLGQMSRYEICKCDSGGFAIKLKGCRGDIVEML
jgi:hypothetical protein